MRRSILRLLLGCAALCAAAGPWTASVQAREAPPAQAAIERWAQAVGGWHALEKSRGAFLHGTRNESGSDMGFDAWVSPRGVKHVLRQPPDVSESVGTAGKSWVKDWNGKVLELQGRDAADQRTATWLETMAYGGLSKGAVRDAHPVSAAPDSTGAFDLVRFEPKGGVAFTLQFDRTSGLPARSSRRPYDDDMIVRFDDWRDVQGIKVPYRWHEFTSADSVGTAMRVESIDFGQEIPAAQFERPADGARDYRFAAGDAAPGIPFNFENDHIMIECRVNGRPPVWFMLDTGAGWTCINTPRLAEFGLEPFGALTVAGGGNSTDLAFTRVERMEVGGVELLHQRNGVLDMSGLERLYGMPMGGILGYDFVSRFVVRVDYRSKTMDLRDPASKPDVGRGVAVPLVLERNHPHVQGTVTVPAAAAIPADFIIDSGAAETANLTSPFVKAHRLTELARKKPAGSPNTIPGMETQFFAQTSVRGHLGSVKLGPFTMTDTPVNLQMGAKGFYARASFSGTIGEGVLKRFTTTYDYSRRVLVLEPNADFAVPFPARKTFGATFVSEGQEYHTFKVSGVRKGTPAETAGLQKGDAIETLDGKPAAEFRLADLRRALAEEGSQHVLEITRGSEPRRSIPVTITMVSIEDL